MKANNNDDNCLLLSLRSSDGLTNPPVLLVDGYNIIGRMRQHSVSQTGLYNSYALDEFRAELLHNITEFSHFRGRRVPLTIYTAV